MRFFIRSSKPGLNTPILYFIVQENGGREEYTGLKFTDAMEANDACWNMNREAAKREAYERGK